MTSDRGDAGMATAEADQARSPGGGAAPKGVEVAGRRVQKARAGMAVGEDLVATYRAAQAFLVAEWAGAVVMVLSFILLYVLYAAYNWKPLNILLVSGAAMALGSWMYLRSHAYYKRLDFPHRRRWDILAMLLAGSAAVFWLLFATLWVLVALGVPVGPG